MASGDITDSLVSKLQIRMENPEADKFTNSMCIKALDYAHVSVAQMLRPEYLSEFQQIDAALAMTAYKASFALFTYTPLNYSQGILAVKDDASGDYLQRIHPSRLRRYANTYLAGGATNKVFWVIAAYINTSTGGGATDAITVYYLRTPAELTTDVDPLLNSYYHNIMLNFAEAQLWTANKSLERRKAKLDEAYAQVKILNEKYIEPLGVGITERNK